MQEPTDQVPTCAMQNAWEITIVMNLPMQILDDVEDWNFRQGIYLKTVSARSCAENFVRTGVGKFSEMCESDFPVLNGAEIQYLVKI